MEAIQLVAQYEELCLVDASLGLLQLQDRIQSVFMVLVEHLAQLVSDSLRLDDFAVVAPLNEVSEAKDVDLVRLKSSLVKHQLQFFPLF